MPCKNHPLVEGPLLRCARCGESFCRDCVVEISGRTYCAVCKQEALGDLRAGLPATGLDLASIGRRFGAMFLDGLVLGVPLMIAIFAIFAALGLFSGRQPDPFFILTIEGVIWLVAITASILYEGLMLRYGGQTLGKKWLAIKVVTPEGSDLSSRQAFGRAALRQVIGLVPCLGLIDYLWAFGQDRTCIHDIGARTRVVNWRPTGAWS